MHAGAESTKQWASKQEPNRELCRCKLKDARFLHLFPEFNNSSNCWDKMEPLVEFVGWQIKPKEEISISEEVDEDSLVTVHITQLALGQAPSNDRHTVFIANESGKFAIGTLDKDKPHFSVDFMAAESDLIFSHTGRPFTF